MSKSYVQVNYLEWLKVLAATHNSEFDQSLLTDEFLQGALEAWLLIPYPQRASVSWHGYLMSLVGIP